MKWVAPAGMSPEERHRLRCAGDLRRWSAPGIVAAQQSQRFAAGRLNVGAPTPPDDALVIAGDRYILPQIGTPLFVRNTGLIAWGIATGTRSPFNHIGMYVGRVNVVREPVPAILEARPTGAMLTPLSDFILTKDIREAQWGAVPEFNTQAHHNVSRNTDSNRHATNAVADNVADEEQRLRAVAARVGMGMIKTPYGWAGVVAIGALQFGIHNHWVDEHVRAMDNAFCSQLYSWSVISAGVTLNGVGTAADSDDGHRHVAPNVWGVSPGDLARGRDLTPLTPNQNPNL